MSYFMVVLMAFATAVSLAQEPPRYVAKRIRIDYSHLPFDRNASRDEESEYMGRVYVVYVLAAQKQSVADHVATILPWIDADQRIVEKWNHLVTDYHYRIVALESESPGVETGVNPHRHEVFLNLEEGVYLESDPALLLVGAICDADFLHSTQQFSKNSALETESYRQVLDRFFESSSFKDLKDSREARLLVSRAWMRRRTLEWQMSWYEKAVARNPMIRRPAFSRLVEQAKTDPEGFKRSEINALASREAGDYQALLADAWAYTLPQWYDLPK